MRPLRVFLCHASQDKPAVRKLHRYLKQRGVQPWLDQLDLLPGEKWEVEIPKALFSSDVILVCLSKNSVDKEGYVQKEITFALDKAQEKPEGTIFIVPVKLEDCEVPRRLKQYQWVDVFRQDGYKRLMLGLQKRASGLGADVSPVILDETRKTPKPEKKKPEEPIVSVPAPSEEEVKEEPKKEIPVSQQEKKEPEVKFTQQKPFTKLLEPSMLFAQKVLQPQSDTPIVKVVPKQKPMRWLGIGGIILLAFILGGFGLNYLVNLLVPIATPSPTDIVTPKPPSFTSVPFTSTPQPIKTLILTPTKTPNPMPTLGIGSTMVSEKDGMALVYVPAGEFTMGSDNGSSDERPAHQVYLDAFWIDQTEVTNAMYAKCVDDGKCEPPSNTEHFQRSGYADHPVVYVNWDMAKIYCEWADKRLPTESEWEKAARGTDARTYPWGEEIGCDRANYNGGCVGDTSAVGSYELGKSPYKAYDMAGNVWEWVNDRYSETYYRNSPYVNPLGPDTGQYHVLRGGPWFNYSGNDVRSANRQWDVFGYQNLVGFRCARSVE